MLTLSCGRQDGYVHDPSELTMEDRHQIQTVRASPLGKPALMREVVNGMVSEDSQLGDCEYWVTKIIDGDKIKNRKGLYPFHYQVKCLADVGDNSLEYIWEVDHSEFGIVSFHWAFAREPD